MGIFIFKPVLGRVVFSLTFPWTSWLEITGFGISCNFFCLSIQGFWTWTAKNFVKNQPNALELRTIHRMKSILSPL
jgi:hypothetical protein